MIKIYFVKFKKNNGKKVYFCGRKQRKEYSKAQNQDENMYFEKVQRQKKYVHRVE